MVKISQKAFNMELDKYISSRREKTPRKPIKMPEMPKLNINLDFLKKIKDIKRPEFNFKKKTPHKIIEKELGEEAAEEQPVFNEEVTNFDPITGNVISSNENEFSDEEYESLDELNEEVEKKSVLKRIKSMFRREKIYSQDEILENISQSVPTIPEDIKEALRIQNNWLKKLSPARMKEFKDSEDFELYKQILETYGLIRK